MATFGSRPVVKKWLFRLTVVLTYFSVFAAVLSIPDAFLAMPFLLALGGALSLLVWHLYPAASSDDWVTTAARPPLWVAARLLRLAEWRKDQWNRLSFGHTIAQLTGGTMVAAICSGVAILCALLVFQDDDFFGGAILFLAAAFLDSATFLPPLPRIIDVKQHCFHVAS